MSPRNEEANQQIRDERREQILQAALKVFAVKGLAATKISDIATAAGLSHGLIYHYFDSKDEIFTELVMLAFRVSNNTIIDAVNLADQSPGERFRAMAEAILAHAYQGMGPYYFLIVNQAFTSEAVPAEVKKMTAAQQSFYSDYLIPLIVEGQEKGEIAPGDPLELAVAFMSVFQGIAINKVQSGGCLPIPAAEIVLRILKQAKE